MDTISVGKWVDFIDSQQPDSVKELSRVITAYELWGVPNHYAAQLIRMRDKFGWNDCVRDTARACVALYDAGIVFPDSERWLLSLQDGGSWNGDVYDTSYALIALGDISEYNDKGCIWLVDNYSEDWEHVGTIALIITALIKQDATERNVVYRDFVNEHAKWLLSRREEDGGWKHISTSNLVIQALILSGHRDELELSIQWLHSRMEEMVGNKEKRNILPVALSMTTLGMYYEEQMNSEPGENICSLDKI